MYSAGEVSASGANVATLLDSLAYAGLCAFVFAFSSGLDGRVVGSLVLANAVALIPVGLLGLRVLVDKRIRRLNDLHFLLIAFVAWAAASYLWTVSPDHTRVRMGTYLALLVFLALIWELANSATRVRRLIISYMFGASAASLMTIYNYLLGESYSKLEGKEWDTFRYTAKGVNPDELGLIVALSIPMAFYLIITSRNRALRAACWCHVVVGVTAMLLTGTRGAMIALALGLIAMIGPTISRMSAMQLAIASLACGAIVCGALFFVPQNALDRFTSVREELTEGTMTHRTQLWSAGMEVFREHPFVGVGSGAYGPAIQSIVDVDLIGHNTFISVLVELGVVGALLFAAILATLVLIALRLPYLEKRLWIALLATWAIGVCTVSWEYRKTTWFLFGLLVAHCYAMHTVLLRRRHAAAQTELRPQPLILARVSASRALND